MDRTCTDQARAALDAANAADPKREADGRPASLRYADGIDRWIARLVPTPSPHLQVAARGQHLERWAIARETFPMDRPGYHAWRRAVHARQGDRARELLAGILTEDDRERIAVLVAKAAPKGDAEGQALEDAACLLFLDEEIAGFAAEHQDYDAAKYITILKRTWVKMSPQAQDLAKAIPLEEPFAGLVRQALA